MLGGCVYIVRRNTSSVLGIYAILGEGAMVPGMDCYEAVVMMTRSQYCEFVRRIVAFGADVVDILVLVFPWNYDICVRDILWLPVSTHRTLIKTGLECSDVTAQDPSGAEKA